MAIQEAIQIIIKKVKLTETTDQIEVPLKYLFDCYKRVEIEILQYPKVRNKFNLLKTLVMLIIYFVF